MSATPSGILYLVPTPLDFGCHTDQWAALDEVLPLATMKVAARLQYWIAENAKSTRAFLNRIHQVVPLEQPIQQHHIQELPRSLHKKGDFGDRPVDRKVLKDLLAPALAGHAIGLVSEAGMPAVADPGALVVRMAHQLGIAVRVLVGPSSLLMALAASGLNGQHFSFVGYLPQSPADRVQRIRELERHSLVTGQAQLFIETPFRNEALLGALVNTLQPSTQLAVSLGLTLKHSSDPTHRVHHSAPVSAWRQRIPQADWRLPAIFAIGS